MSARNPIYDCLPYGTVSDSQLAIRYGLNMRHVAAHRRLRGIKACYERRVLPRATWDVQPLGKLTDDAIAKQLGVSPGAVRRQRILRGIAPLKRVKRVGCRPEEALVGSILRALGRFPIWFRELRARVVDDYGSVEERRLWRYLGALISQGRVLRCSDGEASHSCYRLSSVELRRPLAA